MESVETRRFTFDEFRRMADAGLFQDERVELLDGEVLRMSPIGELHQAAVVRLTRFFIEALRGRAVVSPQGAIRLDAFSGPQPDLAILRFKDDDYESGLPTPADVLLLVEVADTSERYDRLVKAPRYARAGVAETWIVLVEKRVVEVHADPSPDGYRDRREAGRDAVLVPRVLPDLRFPVGPVLRWT